MCEWQGREQDDEESLVARDGKDGCGAEKLKYWFWQRRAGEAGPRELSRQGVAGEGGADSCSGA